MGRTEGLHGGHRQRMREKFLKFGLEAFAPHEQLEFILFYAIPQKDTNGIAHALLDRFGSIAGVLNAPLDELCKVNGIGENAAVYLKMLPQLFRVYAQDAETGRPRFTSRKQIANYLMKRFIARGNEAVVLLLLDSAGRQLFCDVVNEGSASSTDIYIKPMVELAARYRAVYAVLAHNHPSGVCLPSQQDIDATQWVYSAFCAVEVRLLDHLIFAGNDYISLCESGVAPSLFSEDGAPFRMEAADRRKPKVKRNG